MKEDSKNRSIPAELEARVVALLLGEVSDFEREELERLIREQPELAALKDDLQHLNGLLQDVGSGDPSPPGDWKLPPSKRDHLLAVINGEADPQSAQAFVVRPDQKRPWYRRVSHFTVAGLVAATILGFLLWPAAQLAREAAPHVMSASGSLSKSAEDGISFSAPSETAALELDEFADMSMDGSGMRMDATAAPPAASKGMSVNTDGGTEMLFQRARENAAGDAEAKSQAEAAFAQAKAAQEKAEVMRSQLEATRRPVDSSKSALNSIRDSLDAGIATGGQSLPSPDYLQDDVQYFPAGPAFKLPAEPAAPEKPKPQTSTRYAETGKQPMGGPGGSAQASGNEEYFERSAPTLALPAIVDEVDRDFDGDGNSNHTYSVGGVIVNEVEKTAPQAETDPSLPDVSFESPSQGNQDAPNASPESSEGWQGRASFGDGVVAAEAGDSMAGEPGRSGSDFGGAAAGNGSSDSQPLSGENGQVLGLDSRRVAQGGFGGGGGFGGRTIDGQPNAPDAASATLKKSGDQFADPIDRIDMAELADPMAQSAEEEEKLRIRRDLDLDGEMVPSTENRPLADYSDAYRAKSTKEFNEEIAELEARQLGKQQGQSSAPANKEVTVIPLPRSEREHAGKALDRLLEEKESEERRKDDSGRGEWSEMDDKIVLDRKKEREVDLRETNKDLLNDFQYEWKSSVAKAQVPDGLGEKSAADEAFSTFSLHVSDVSFKLARAALAAGSWPDAATVRIEEFVNAFDYGDPMPSQDEKVACRIEQSAHPFLQQRNLLRVSMRTAAAGRAANTPLRLTFLVDNSGSMERIDRRQTLRRAFSLLAGQLQPMDQVTLIGFSRRPRLLADKVSGDQANQLVQIIDQLPSEGGTNIEEALQLAFEKALEQQVAGAQNRIILLTDGAVNLGDADPLSLARMITTMRGRGVAFDAAGISAEGLNDEILEALTRQGDGRYYLLDSMEAADEGFVRQIAGALRPSAQNVKVQVEFNPNRVGQYKLLGFEKHLLNKEDFRNDKVDAAEMAAEEAGVAVYQFEAKPDGVGDIGTVFVRFRDLSSGQMIEKSWPIPYQADAARLEHAAPSLQVAAVSALLAAKLKGEPLGESVDLRTLAGVMASLPESIRSAPRIAELQQMIAQARQLSGN